MIAIGQPHEVNFVSKNRSENGVTKFSSDGRELIRLEAFVVFAVAVAAAAAMILCCVFVIINTRNSKLYAKKMEGESNSETTKRPSRHHRRPDLTNVVDAINDQIPPIFSGHCNDVRVTRKSLGISSTNYYCIHLDIGGEGFHKCNHNMVSGFHDAININDKDTHSQPPFGKIPLLVKVPAWTTDPSFPFEDSFADYITMQGTPFTDKTVYEIARCLRYGGEVGLWIDADEYDDRIRKLAGMLYSTPEFNADDEFKGQAGFGKVRIVANNKNKL